MSDPAHLSMHRTHVKAKLDPQKFTVSQVNATAGVINKCFLSIYTHTKRIIQVSHVILWCPRLDLFAVGSGPRFNIVRRLLSLLASSVSSFVQQRELQPAFLHARPVMKASPKLDTSRNANQRGKYLFLINYKARFILLLFLKRGVRRLRGEYYLPPLRCCCSPRRL